MRLRLRLLALLVASLTLLAACSSAAPTDSKNNGATTGPSDAPKKTVKLTFSFNSKNPLVVPLAYHYIGKELGYFKEEGIEVEFVGSDGAGQNLQFLMAGQTDLVSGLQDAILQVAAKGEKPKVQMVYNYTKGIIYQLGVSPNSPIKSPADLKGKKVGVLALAHPGYDYAKQVVRDAGLNPEKDVTWVVVGQGAPAGAALKSGQVDALALWDFHYVDLEVIGYPTKLIPHPPNFEKIYAGHTISVNTDKMKDPAYKRAVVGYLRAMSKAIIFQDTNPEAAVKMMWKLYPESKPTDLPEAEELKRAVNQYKLRAERMRITPGALGNFEEAGWKDYAKFLNLEGKVNPADWYTNEFTTEVNKFDPETVKKAAREYKG